MKRFVIIKDSLGFLALCDLRDLQFFQKLFSSIFFGFSRFSVEKDEFFTVSSWGKWFSSLMRILSGNFWRCEIDKILTIGLLPLVLRMILLFRFSLQKLSSQVFAKHGFASVLKFLSMKLYYVWYAPFRIF